MYVIGPVLLLSYDNLSLKYKSFEAKAKNVVINKYFFIYHFRFDKFNDYIASIRLSRNGIPRMRSVALRFSGHFFNIH